jgi:hypothetical protein
MQAPPVMVLSLPRSGSSWVGQTLGSASNAAYLREPFTDLHIAAGNVQAVFDFAVDAPPDTYVRAGRLAFRGVPGFPREERILKDAAQWSLRGRRQRRLVIKEINPFATAWFVREAQPRCVLLVRHPAAIALSYRQRGWGIRQPWHWFGDFFGRALSTAWKALQTYPNMRVVTYETLCLEPQETFASLFGFAGLTWDASSEATVRQSTSGVSGRLARNSSSMARSWVGKLKADELAELRGAFEAHGLPWYQAPEDWS